ncbi:unnamed protein product [Rotaria sordida]|uniref:HP domain-containing protein n=1 Tax=Rotaria sordida TaxID=392033 RepID=A0A815PF63_9BILA|nr:unnamed protein product [Rotaria sordida]
MSIAVTEFYYAHLLQPNVCDRLISLCVSHTLAIDNGLWLASNLSAFINLRHLSLIDIKRSCFELMLNTSTPNTSLVIFNVHYTEYYQAAYTFKGVSEGAYYKRIFRLFPLLRVCRLRFRRDIYNTLDTQIVLPLNKTFIPIETNHLHLQSLVLRECSPAFLSHLLEYYPQLEELSFDQSTPWLPDKHPLLNNYNNQMFRIDKRLVPNLRCLKITLKDDINAMELLDKLFDHDVLFSLTKFTLEGIVTGPNVVSKLLSMLCHQCSYTYIVNWFVKTTISLSNASSILLNALQQLKGRIPIELELFLYNDSYSIKAFTLPRKDKYLCAYTYLNKNIVHVQSHWSCTLSTVLNNRLTCINTIALNALCLIDTDTELYIWQGWNDLSDDELDLQLYNANIQAGSPRDIRFTAERRCAFLTAVEYCKAKTGSATVDLPCSIEGKKLDQKDSVIDMLTHLCPEQYTIEELRARPLPEGVNTSKIEFYLSDDDFQKEFRMTKDEFYALPYWKQTNIKKSLGFF